MFRLPRAYVEAILLAMLCMVAGAAVAPPAQAAPVTPGCRAAVLPGLSAQFARALRETREVRPAPGEALPARTGALAVGPAADFWRVARAILGPAGDDLVAAADVAPFVAVGAPSSAALPCDRGVLARDGVAWSMGLTGYSAQEIADVLGGHLSRADLDHARARLMAGHPRASVAAFLEARWREPVAPELTARSAAPPVPGPLLALAHLEHDIETLSRRHGVPADLVRAVIAAESAGNARAVSPAGAIGLMQLMPATAASLGVNPWLPLENLHGGIAYLASLLRSYGGNARLALIAYNAGPQHATRVRDGSAVAYRETRRYLDAIGARYALP